MMNKSLNISFVLIVLFGLMGFSSQSEIHPFTKGSLNTIKKAHESSPLIVTFWGEDCAYCMKQMTTLSKLLPSYANVRLVIVSVDPFLAENAVHDKLKTVGLTGAETWVFASDYPELLYADVDRRWRGELPFTLFINNKGEQIRQSGLLAEKELTDWLEANAN